MLHLPAERLAALADHDPTPAEAEHLAACAACCRERDAYRALVAMAAARRDAAGEPLLTWDALAGRLRDERLLTDDVGRSATDVPAHRPARGSWTDRPWVRAAAAVLLVAGGVAVGRASARVAPTGPVAPPVAIAAPDTGAPSFATQADALQAMARAERVYQSAAAFLVRADTAASLDPETYRTRLATLDRVAEETRDALREAPHDPVINRYYFTTLGARQATLQQLRATLAPQGYRLTQF
jgi:hypothetical protein